MSHRIDFQTGLQALKRVWGSVVAHTVGTATPGALGAIRVLTCAILIVNISWEDVASTALIPRSLAHPMGITGWLWRFPIYSWFVTQPHALNVFKWFTLTILFLASVGYKTRWMVPIAAACALLHGGILREYCHFFHAGLLPVYLLFILSLTPCGDGWSLDRLRKLAQGTPVPPSDMPEPLYAWCRYACWIAIASVYVASGTSKIRNGGLSWWDADNLRSIIYTDNLNPMHFHFTLGLSLRNAPDYVFALLGLSAVLVETSYGLILISRLARKVLPFLAIGVHLGIFLLQNVLFFDLIFVQLAVIDWVGLKDRLARRLEKSRGMIQVLYDGNCPLCQRTVRVLRALDLLHRLEMLDFRQLDLEHYNQRLKGALRLATLEQEMAVVSRDNVHFGFRAYRRLASALPISWGIWPFLWLPGVSQAGEALYRFVARNRLKLMKCDESCHLTPVSSASSSPFGNWAGLYYPVLVIWIGCALAYFSLRRRQEFYPLTGWQMYADRDRSGTSVYYKLIARDAAGHPISFNPERYAWAFADTRYRDIISKFFENPPDPGAIQFIEDCARALNRRAVRSQQIVSVEAQLCRWDFRHEPSSPSFGRVEKSYVCVLSGNRVPSERSRSGHSPD